jgi:hypothetical protein
VTGADVALAARTGNGNGSSVVQALPFGSKRCVRERNLPTLPTIPPAT